MVSREVKDDCEYTDIMDMAAIRLLLPFVPFLLTDRRRRVPLDRLRKVYFEENWEYMDTASSSMSDDGWMRSGDGDR
jgi:hypothetical protein